MRDLRAFREAVRVHRRAVGRTQQQLARSIGLHPDVLSHKLHERDNAVLTAPEVIGIATTLAGWGALVTTADLHELLELMEVPRQAIPAAAWRAPPLASLRAGRTDAAARRPAARPKPGTAVLTAPAALPGQPDEERPRVTPVPLPAPATSLIGRAQERATVAAAVADSRLVTLTGVGGTGKTRLALQVARDLAGSFTDGAAFVDLAPVRDPALLGTAVALALGLAPKSVEAAEAHLAKTLRDREILLVVDNAEHLLDGTPLLARLMAAAPAVRVLATSRVPLRLYGEQTVRIPPLDLPGPGSTAADSAAVRLFITRARAARPDFAPDADDLAAIGEICVTLDGLPLAIELAASRIRLYPPAALLPLLQSRLSLLTGGPRDLPQRQQTLRAALDWSHALLAQDEQRLFACLGVFAGPFSAVAAAGVSGVRDPARTLELLVSLADHSLLELTVGETPHFRMLQTVREYALARLAEAAELGTVRRQHLAHFLTLTLAASEGLYGPEQASLLDRLERAYPNIRAALEFACHRAEFDSSCLEEGLRLADALTLLWLRRGPLAEGVLYLDQLLALDDAARRPTSPRVRASAVLTACALACYQSDYRRAAELARHAIELCGPLDDHKGLARAHRFLGETALAVGADDAAEPYFERELAEACRAGDVSWQADAHNMLAEVARHHGEFRCAQALLWEALRLYHQADNPGGVAAMLSGLGEVARDAGRPAAARRLYGAALRRHSVLGDKRHMAYELEGFAAAAGLEGAGRQALIYLGAAQTLREETGSPQPPVERSIVDRILAPALAGLSAQERQEALSQGRNQPLPVIVQRALDQSGSTMAATRRTGAVVETAG